MSELKSVFDSRKLADIYDEIRSVYLSDNRPWVLGYSGGKDSSCALQLIWTALAELKTEERTKPIYVISSDTLVESPPLIEYVKGIHKLINEAAKNQGLPISAQQIFPKIEDTFWVNLLGKGYPAPQNTFRWCTSRLKIKPADQFIMNKVNEFGEVILILGVRKEESTTRAQVMSLYKIKDSLLSRHSRFSNAFVYTPIENFTVDDVWNYLLQKKSPWGANNRELLSLYTSKNAGECPLVVDKTTPSCGGSRFGCWTCTVVSKDKAMQNLIDDGQVWLKPLLELRDYLFETTNPEIKKEVREYKAKGGFVRFKTNDPTKISRGPYTLNFCKELLRKILNAQKKIDSEKPNLNFKVIQEEEIHAIRNIWINERGDWEDSIPRIYREIMGDNLEWSSEDLGSFSEKDSKLLGKICSDNDVPLQLVKKLLDVERQVQGMTRRSGVFNKIDSVFKEEWRSEEQILDEISMTEVENAN